MDWCEEKNINPPSFYMPNSSDKVWWSCVNGHEWQARIVRRTRLNTGCPYCSGRFPTPERNLAVSFPKIAAEWNLKKNKISANKVSFGSDKKYWWICDRGHEWQTSSNSRTAAGRGCPECAKLLHSERTRRATQKLNLQTQFPEICLEWHIEKNINPPAYYMPGSSDKVWWKCNNGHEWKTGIVNRTLRRTGCPYCSGKRASKEYNFTLAFPDLVKEWHPLKNALSPERYTPKSNKSRIFFGIILCQPIQNPTL